MQYWLKNAIFAQKVGIFFNPFFFIDLAARNPGIKWYRNERINRYLQRGLIYMDTLEHDVLSVTRED
jgi:hypothetical protein